MAAASVEVEGFDLDAALRSALRGVPEHLNAHLVNVEKEIQVGTTRTRLCCYALPVDGNGRVRVKPLAEFLRNRIIDYAIPRSTYEKAKEEETKTGSAASIAGLHEEARRLFTDLAKTGEGGELLLFAMAEMVYGLSQIICKMSLKTSAKVHYHGSDGVYAEARPDGGLNVYWGESKIYSDIKSAVTACLESLAPFLVDEDSETSARSRDIVLINEFADLNDTTLIEGIKRFLDLDDPASLTTVHCGIALVAFDCSAYPSDDAQAIADDIAAEVKSQLSNWKNWVESGVAAKKLANFDIKFICVPMPSAEAFRSYFLRALGLSL